MTHTPPQESWSSHVLRASAALRSRAASLRELSAATRQAAADSRARSIAARRRARQQTASVADRRAMGEPVAVPAAASLPSDEVELDELVEILTQHHGMPPGNAIIGVAVEMERAGYPLYVDAVRGGEALDMVRRVVDGFGHTTL